MLTTSKRHQIQMTYIYIGVILQLGIAVHAYINYIYSIYHAYRTLYTNLVRNVKIQFNIYFMVILLQCLNPLVSQIWVNSTQPRVMCKLCIMCHYLPFPALRGFEIDRNRDLEITRDLDLEIDRDLSLTLCKMKVPYPHEKQYVDESYCIVRSVGYKTQHLTKLCHFLKY